MRQQNVCKIPTSPYSIQNQNGGVITNGTTAIPATKHSMLDKLKLFNKEKSDRSSKTQISKRTSSSSGFSSARSERSDSSLSLNNDTNIVKTAGVPAQQQLSQSNLKKPEVVATRTKSKLLSSSTKSGSKDTLSKKSDKKDKSPARMSADMSESKIAVPKTQKSSTKVESKLKPVPATKKSLDQRSDSKSNLSQIPSPNVKSTNATMVNSQTANAQAVVTTGIPKPMAAIKGTTKLQTPLLNAHNQIQVKSNETFTDIKCDNLVDISNQNNNISTNQDGGKMQIIAPILIENAVNQQQQMANHFHMQQALNQQNISMSDSCHSKSTHSSSNGPMSNSSESSIIYRPSSESGVSDTMSMRHNTSMSPQSKILLANRAKLDRFGVNDQIGVNVMMIKAPSNGSIASSASSSIAGISQPTSNVNKFNTVPSKMMQNINGIIYEEEKHMTVVPMRPLLRGYNSHLTLPTRGNRNHMASDYSDDLSQGYCSDGDALRKVPVRYSDIENGYMSEGGVSPSNGNTMHHKPMLLRARTQLPTTIEER